MPLPRFQLGRPVPVSGEVRAGLQAVQRSGRTNMLDRPAVADLADALGFPEAARWARENGPAYSRGIFGGFEAMADPKETAR